MWSPETGVVLPAEGTSTRNFFVWHTPRCGDNIRNLQEVLRE